MPYQQLAKQAEDYLRRLCVDIPDRRVGSVGNRAAAAFAADRMAAFGFEVERQEFACMDWRAGSVHLAAGDTAFTASASPYSLGCAVRAPLRVVTTVEELAAAALDDAVVLLRGAIASEQLMPKNFPFYNPDEHQRIIALLEAKRPQAIIAATGRDWQMAGSLYPFPLIEDGDFDIPSVLMTDVEGERLAACAGQTVTLESSAERIPAAASNVSAFKGARRDRRAVCFAHIDAKPGTPGAIDNASGVIVMLLLAELLADYKGTLGIEIVALNGEDYYSSPGEQVYLARHAGAFDQIVLGVNVDGVGYQRGRVAYSLYDCPDNIAALARAAFAGEDVFVEGQPWYQGDHVLFLMNQRPALALTSEFVVELMTEVIHTAQDHPGVVDPARLAATALALREVLLALAAV